LSTFVKQRTCQLLLLRLKGLLGGGGDAEMAAFIERTIQQKEARHHIGEPAFLKPSRGMVHIGG
jgi:hypothetical protein